MKAETRYIAYDGTAFVYSEDAQYHEIIKRLQAKRDALAQLVGTYMYGITKYRRAITSIEKTLKEINEKLRTPEVYETSEHVKLMINRINHRADLHMNIRSLNDIKLAAAKYNRKLSKTDSDIKRYTEIHDNLVKNRNGFLTNEKTEK